MEDDYYRILGLERSASENDIQRAYREMAKKHHPDLNPEDKTAKTNFQKIQKAYEILNDPDKREMYDRYGSSFESAGPGGGTGPFGGRGFGGFGGGPNGGFEEVDMSELFGQRFGGPGAGGPGGFADIFKQFSRGGAQSASRREPRRGADIRHELEIPFATSVTGGEAYLKVSRAGGKVEAINVKIPPGIEDGKKLRLRGQGEAAPSGGPAGDILIRVRVGSHPHFVRQGNNLVLKLPVTVAEAALGAKVDVPTPKGAITLTIPPNTSSGRRLRIKGHGVAGTNDAAGDLLAEVQIVLPESIDEPRQDLIRQFDQAGTIEPRADLKW